jgi:L-alanine-DL-glutamate epimerase-like enolase superfamily enzyme
MGAIEAAAATEQAAIRGMSVACYAIPTDQPESDGTLEWRATTLITVQLDCGGRRGFGYTYADRAAAALIHGLLLPLIDHANALDIPARWREMARALRNAGRPGAGSMALSAVDAALWDLKAKLFGVPLIDLLGASRDAIAVYGSGGFTSYSREQVCRQLADWAASGMRFVKMKVGRDAHADLSRVAAARREIGRDTALFVDANGAYARKQALEQAERFAESSVAWFEEPVSSDDLEGLRLIRDRAPAGMAIAAGEYGYDAMYFRRMLEAGAVDVLQADATRCGGISGFMEAAALCAAHGLPLSSHCAPSLHVAPCCAAGQAIHLEYFHDHVRLEQMLFDGFRTAMDGLVAPDRSRPGLGIELKVRDAEKWRV